MATARVRQNCILNMHSTQTLPRSVGDAAFVQHQHPLSVSPKWQMLCPAINSFSLPSAFLLHAVTWTSTRDLDGVETVWPHAEMAVILRPMCVVCTIFHAGRNATFSNSRLGRKRTSLPLSVTGLVGAVGCEIRISEDRIRDGEGLGR